MFATPQTGVRAHIQLLKKFALGNDAPLATRDVAPDAAARATDWADLAGTWASDPGYWVSLSRLFTAILDDAGRCGTTDTASAIAPGPFTLTVVHGITVNTAVAGPLGAMLNAAQTDGLILSGAGYRSHERQIELRRAHCGTSNYAIYEMPSSQCSPPTARPGASMHEQGLAVDFANCSSRASRCWQWLNANAAAYGLFNLPSEPWHCSTSGA